MKIYKVTIAHDEVPNVYFIVDNLVSTSITLPEEVKWITIGKDDLILVEMITIE